MGSVGRRRDELSQDEALAQTTALDAEHIAQALRWVGQRPWLDESDESAESQAAYLEGFVARNGPLTLATLTQLVAARAPARGIPRTQVGDVLEPHTDEDFDALFAVAALGATGTEMARDQLLPFLNSPDAQARWVAAIALAEMHEALALPALARMLVEFLPPNVPRDRYGGVISFFHDNRPRLPRMIWEWGPPGAASVLRRGVIAALEGEAAIPQPDSPRPLRRYAGVDAALVAARAEAWFDYDCARVWVIDLQHDLVYGLGRLNALGALTGLSVPADVFYSGSRYSTERIVSTAHAVTHAERFRLNIWRVHAVCGLLEPEYNYPQPHSRFHEIPRFTPLVEQVLEDRFGLGREEREEVLRDYELVGALYRTTEQMIRTQQARAEGTDNRQESGSK